MIEEMIRDDIYYKLNFSGTLCEYLKFVRESKKMNSTTLSKLVGKSNAYVSHLEKGRYNKPDYETLYKILKILGIGEEKIEDYLLHFGILSPERNDLYSQKIIENFESGSKEVETLVEKPKKINTKYMNQSTLDEVMSQIKTDAQTIAEELVDLNCETKKLLIELLQKQLR